MYKRYRAISGGLKLDDEFKWCTCASQETDLAEECLRVEFDGQSFKVMKKFCCLGITIGTRGAIVVNVIS